MQAGAIELCDKKMAQSFSFALTAINQTRALSYYLDHGRQEKQKEESQGQKEACRRFEKDH